MSQVIYHQKKYVVTKVQTKNAEVEHLVDGQRRMTSVEFRPYRQPLGEWHLSNGRPAITHVKSGSRQLGLITRNRRYRFTAMPHSNAILLSISLSVARSLRRS